MVSSSSSSSRNWRYDVFTSFHGPDVRSKFLSHLRKQFDDNSIIMFDDTGIERSQIIGSALTNAIKESRIAIVLLSKNYASSSWCLDELLEIMKCKEDIGKIVMTIFYEVDPSHVRKQTGDFGKAFNKTCDGTTDEKKREWSQALTYVSKIAGEDFKNCDNEAKRIEKIASDVSNKLIASSRSFDDMVGLEDHLKKVESLLDLAYDGAKIVGISGPAGIGKSTIARALHSRLYNRFDHTCFMDNLRENYKNGPVDYRLKLRLEEKLLSNMLNLNGIRICHLRLIKDRLQDTKVLIILDDVDDVDQLETLANIEWFGPGSRVIVTTTNKEILQQHGISDIYHVGFPSEREALMIFCISAFGERSPPAEFMNLAYEVVRICGNLPLALRVLGSSLWGKSHAEWIDELPRLRNRLDGNIESVLIVGFESLDKKVQSLFLCIAIFFNYEHADHVTSMLAKTTLDVRLGLKILANKYLIHIDHDDESRVVMHRLLQVMAREVISKQAFWKRQVLVDAHKIRDVLEDADTLSGTGSIVGVSFNVAEIKQLIIRASAFKRMCNLVFLKVYGWRPTRERQLHIPEEMEFPPGLRLLDWDAYPRKSLPLRFCTKNLVELRMVRSKLEKLWEGTKALANLKIMNLLRSSRLKELPDLSNATNLERLDLSFCTALVELPASIRHCSRLEYVDISSSRNLKSLTHLPKSVTHLKLSNSGIERITDCIKGLHNLQVLNLSACKRLVSLPELPGSLKRLVANDCDALERVNSPLNTPDAELDFTNCLKLGRQARRAVIQQSFVHGWAFLPGREVPAEFDHRARRSSLTFPHTAIDKFKVCVVISPNHHQATELIVAELLYDCKVIGNSVKLADMKFNLSDVSSLRKAHLFIFHSNLSFIDHSEVSRERMVQFSISCQAFNIIECGIQILADDSDDSNNGSSGDEDEGNDYWDTHESRKESDREEDNDSIANRRSKAESREMSNKEDDEEDYKSEASEEDDESVLRKRPRNL